MKLFTHFGNLETPSAAKDDVADVMLSAVSKFERRVRKVSVTVRDTNGPKGGKDLCCRCVVHLKRMKPIVIEETGENLRNVLNRVADRVSYTLSQKIDRVNKNGRSGKSRLRVGELLKPTVGDLMEPSFAE